MCQGEFGVSSIKRVAREASLLTEIFSIRATIPALAAGPSQPRDADAVADLKSLNGLAKPLNATDDFMTGNQREVWDRGSSPSTTCRSVRHTAQAATRTRTSSGLISNRCPNARPAVGEGPRGPSHAWELFSRKRLETATRSLGSEARIQSRRRHRADCGRLNRRKLCIC